MYCEWATLLIHRKTEASGLIRVVDCLNRNGIVSIHMGRGYLD